MGNAYAVDSVVQERWHDAETGIVGGTASVHGKRSSMEDALRVWRHVSDQGGVVTTHAAVMDGHSGNDVVIKLAHLVSRHVRGPQTTATATRAFAEIDRALSAVEPALRAGSTATLVSIARAAAQTQAAPKDGKTGGGGVGAGDEKHETQAHEVGANGADRPEDGGDEKTATERASSKEGTARSRTEHVAAGGGGGDAGGGRKRRDVRAKTKSRARRKRKAGTAGGAARVAKRRRVAAAAAAADADENEAKAEGLTSDEKEAKAEGLTLDERVASQTRVEVLQPPCTDVGDAATLHSGYRVTVSWVGDTRCILIGPQGELLHVTNDHQPDDDHEKARIHATGARIDYSNGGARVHSYNVARMFGDFSTRKDAAKLNLPPQLQAISCAPDVADAWLPPGSLVVQACDGLFERLTTLQVVDALRPLILAARAPQTMARFLVRLALASGSQDNISVVVMSLAGP